MKVKRNTLLLLACLVWSAAGFNILRIGLMAYPAYLTMSNYLLSILVFAVFQRFIFGKLVKKHTARIISYRRNGTFSEFFDGKAFAIMAVMMTGGIGLRISGLAPERFIAVFYTGLGASLLLGRITVWPQLWQDHLYRSRHTKQNSAKRRISNAGNYGNFV